MGSDFKWAETQIPAAISIHAPRVGSDVRNGDSCQWYVISIHAPRVGSDHKRQVDRAERIISIHAPRVGSDASLFSAGSQGRTFQSTLPVWGATQIVDCRAVLLRFQSTLPVWGATISSSVFLRMGCISIHAPRVGSDPGILKCSLFSAHFNPRSPCGERRIMCAPPNQAANFNPRSPCGERLCKRYRRRGDARFQSTLPVWGATCA